MTQKRRRRGGVGGSRLPPPSPGGAAAHKERREARVGVQICTRALWPCSERPRDEPRPPPPRTAAPGTSCPLRPGPPAPALPGRGRRPPVQGTPLSDSLPVRNWVPNRNPQPPCPTGRRLSPPFPPVAGMLPYSVGSVTGRQSGNSEHLPQNGFFPDAEVH